MIKKLFAIISISIIFSSCSIFKVTNPTLLSTSEVDAEEIDTALKFIGDYELTAYNLPGRGDQTFKMSITKDKNILSTTFDSESETGFDVLNTLVEDDILFIEIFVVEFGLKTAFEIYVLCRLELIFRVQVDFRIRTQLIFNVKFKFTFSLHTN